MAVTDVFAMLASVKAAGYLSTQRPDAYSAELEGDAV